MRQYNFNEVDWRPTFCLSERIQILFCRITVVFFLKIRDKYAENFIKTRMKNKIEIVERASNKIMNSTVNEVTKIIYRMIHISSLEFGFIINRLDGKFTF